MTRADIEALAWDESITVDGATITRLPGTFVCGRYRVERPGYPPKMAWDARAVLRLVVDPDDFWAPRELHGSFYVLDWLSSYMATNYGTPETYS